MEMIQVTSTDLSAVGYDYDNAILRVEFLKGGLYDYQQVPVELYQGLLEAVSKGKFFSQFIKNGGFPYSRLQ